MTLRIKTPFDFIYILLCLALIVYGIFASSCKTIQPAITVKVHDTTTITNEIVKRDTLYKTKMDSTYYQLYLRCDSLGHVVEVSSNVTNSDHLKTSFTLDNNVLTSKTILDSQAIAFSWFEHNKTVTEKESNDSTITIIQYRDKPLTGFQATKMFIGGWLIWLILGAGVLFVVYKILQNGKFIP